MTAPAQILKKSLLFSIAERLRRPRRRADDTPRIYRMHRAHIGLIIKATGPCHPTMRPSDFAAYLLQRGFLPEGDSQLFAFGVERRFVVDLDAPTLPFTAEEGSEDVGCPFDDLESIGVDSDDSQTWVFEGRGTRHDAPVWPPIDNEDGQGKPIGIARLYREMIARINSTLPESQQINISS